MCCLNQCSDKVDSGWIPHPRNAPMSEMGSLTDLPRPHRHVRFTPRKRTSTPAAGMSVKCRYCCKSRKLHDPKNLAKVDFWTFPLLHRLSTPLRRSAIDFG